MKITISHENCVGHLHFYLIFIRLTKQKSVSFYYLQALVPEGFNQDTKLSVILIFLWIKILFYGKRGILKDEIRK